MNYNKIGMYKRPMNIFEKLATGWRQMFDNGWEWYYHLNETPEELHFEFWHVLNFDLVAYEEEIYYNGCFKCTSVKQLDDEIAKVLYENLWDLYD